MSKLFGTDGVRGVAGTPPLDPVTVTRLGAALVRVLPHRGAGRVLVGRDTRESGDWIEQALARGVASQGAQLVSTGIVPTPAVAYLTGSRDFDAGLVISASHNPFQDNGIKIFSGHGQKFAEAQERDIEVLVADPEFRVDLDTPAAVTREDLVDAYLDHARAMLPSPGALLGARVGLDCANGATATVAPRLFRALGFDVAVIGAEPDGRNINLDCGSTHPEGLSALVRKEKLRFGVAFDGDGDRAILIDADGRIVDGDAVLYLCARHMRAGGRLKGDTIVATVMSNIGLEIALREAGIGMLRCPVGDKYVMEELVRRDLALGGEQSGHVIFSEHLFTGDGIVTALAVVRAMVESGRELSALAGELVTYPQVLVNVRVKEKRALDSVPAVKAVTDAVETRLTGAGRLLIRYSGTEPLLRIMIEGKDQREIQGWADEIASAVRTHLTLNVPRRCRHGPSQRQRQQGRHAAQLARWAPAQRRRRRAHDRRGRGSRHHRAPACRRATHHDPRRARRRGCVEAVARARRVQHRGRHPDRPDGAGARSPARPVHAGPGPRRRGDEPGRVAHRHADPDPARDHRRPARRWHPGQRLHRPGSGRCPVGRRARRRPRRAVHGALRQGIRGRSRGCRSGHAGLHRRRRDGAPARAGGQRRA